MLLTLHIEKEASSRYTARICHGNEVLDSSTYASIAEAISAHGTDPMGDAVAFDVWYGRVSIGTIGLLDMRAKAEQLATDLVSRVAMVEEAFRAEANSRHR